jgi:hypothetical protein
LKEAKATRSILPESLRKRLKQRPNETKADQKLGCSNTLLR